MRILWITLGIIAAFIVLLCYACAYVSGQYDDWEESYMDADWSPVQEQTDHSA